MRANAGRYAVAGVVGAVSGGVAGLVSKGVMATRAAQASTGIVRVANQISSDAIGGTIGAVAGEAADQLITEGELNGRDLFEAGAAGLIVSGAASSAGQLGGLIDDAGRVAAAATPATSLAISEPVVEYIDNRADAIAGQDDLDRR